MTRCFVIGPIGNKFAPFGSEERERYESALEVFEHVILPACAAHNLDPVRADQISVPGEITEQIFRHLKDDEVVIADVSGGNANVMYELGLRHTRDLLTIQIGEFGRLPFDVTAVRTIQFSRSEPGLIDARRALEKALAVGLEEGGDPVTATRVWDSTNPSSRLDVSYTNTIAKMIGQKDDSEPASDHPPDTIELIAAIEQIFPRMNEQMNQVAAILVALGEVAVSSEEEFRFLASSGASATKRLAAIKKFGQNLGPRAEELTRITDAFVADMHSADENVMGVLRHLTENPHEVGEARDFLTTIIDLADTARQAMDELSTFASSARVLGETSRHLRPVAEKMESAVNTLAAGAGKMDDWQAVAQALLVESG